MTVEESQPGQTWASESAPAGAKAEGAAGRIQDEGSIRRIRGRFAEAGVGFEVLSARQAPAAPADVGCTGMPWIWVDAESAVVCAVVSSPGTAVEDVLYISYEALATLEEFPREAGNLVHEAAVSAFALSQISRECGEVKAVRSAKGQLRQLSSAAMNDCLSSQRDHLALRLWSSLAALCRETRELLLDQIDKVDRQTGALVRDVAGQWGWQAPESKEQAEQNAASFRR